MVLVIIYRAEIGIIAQLRILVPRVVTERKIGEQEIAAILNISSGFRAQSVNECRRRYVVMTMWMNAG